MSGIPASHLDLLHDEARALAVLATLMPDGSPQATPVWFDFDGKDVWINSAKGRQKDRNMRLRPQVALCILDPRDPCRYLHLRGRVAEISEAGAVEHLHRLARKYTGQAWRTVPGEVRVRYRITIEHASAHPSRGG